jgi:nucleoside-diphosphate-sugar epimerase
VKGDVLDLDALTVAMGGADICVHAAAVAGIYSVGVNSSKTMKVNMIGTYHALEAATANRVPKFVDFSTSEVYGPFVYRGKETDKTTLGPVGERRWVYAVSKLAGEHFAATYAEESTMQVVSIRPFNVYGPRQVGEGAIREMTLRALADEDIIVYNDGTQIRSWCFVIDFVDGLYRALSANLGRHQVFNIGNPQATTTVLGLAETVIRLTGSRSKIVFKPHPGPEVEMRIPDIQKAAELLDFHPTIGLDEGLRQTIEWCNEHVGLTIAL